MQADRITLIVQNISHFETDKTITVTFTAIIAITIEIIDATMATGSQNTTIDVFTTTTTMDIAVILAKGATTYDRRLRIAGVIRRIRDIRIIVLLTTARLTHDATIIEQPGVTFCAFNAAVAVTSATYAPTILEATAHNVSIQVAASKTSSIWSEPFASKERRY